MARASGIVWIVAFEMEILHAMLLAGLISMPVSNRLFFGETSASMKSIFPGEL